MDDVLDSARTYAEAIEQATAVRNALDGATFSSKAGYQIVANSLKLSMFRRIKQKR